MFDATQVRTFGDELGTALRGSSQSLSGVVRDEGRDVLESWRDNARATSGRAARWYVPSIQAESRRVGFLHHEAEVGPTGPGGGVGFEFGSRNSPPHLAGVKAAQVGEGRFPKRVADWLEGMLS